MGTQTGDTAKLLCDQRSLEPTADRFDRSRLRCVMPPTPNSVIEQPHQHTNVVVKMFRSRTAPVEHVDDLGSKPKAVTLDDYVIRMEIPVVLAVAMDLFDPDDQRVEQV